MQIVYAEPLTRRIIEETHTTAKLLSNKTQKQEFLKTFGLMEELPPLLALRSFYNLPVQIKHCSLHVWYLGVLQWVISSYLESLSTEGLSYFHKLLHCSDYFPSISKRLQELSFDPVTMMLSLADEL